MKRAFLALSVAALALVSCNKKNPDPVVPVAPVVYDGESKIEIAEGTNFYTVKFKATTNWEAKITVSDETEEYSPVTIDKVKGAAGEQTIKVSFEDLETGVAGRMSVLGVSTVGWETMPKAGEYFLIYFMQGKVFFVLPAETQSVGIEGGEVSYQILTNCSYAIKTYDAAGAVYEWAPVTHVKGESVSFNVKENKGYDPRTAYVKFTVEDIQVEGEEGLEAYVTRVYVSQEGNIKEAWRTDFTWDLHADPSSYTIAMAGYKMLLSTGAGVFTIDTTTGTIGSQISLPVIPKGIANDSAGNIIVYTGGDYPLSEGDPYEPLKVYVLDSADPTDFTKAKLVVNYLNGFYGYALDNIRVTGDITKDACIDCISAAGWDGGSNILSFEIKNGTSVETTADYVGLPWTSAIWASRNMVAKHIGTTVDSGVLTIGYDGNYNLHYNSSMSSANWKEVLTTGSTWAEGYNAIDIIDWNGHKYAAFIGMSYFGKTNWGDETAPWSYMPSYLWLVNIDNPEAPVTVSTSEYKMTEDLFVYGATTDIKLVIEGSDLCAYIVDAGVSVIRKVVFPAI